MKLRLQSKYLGIAVVVALALFLQACASTASAGVSERPVGTHPSQGDVRTIEAASARFNTTESGISAVLQTRELTPGHVYTMWVVIMNAPDACAHRPCAPPDVLMNTAATKSDVTYGDGIVAGPDGTGTFRTFVPTGTRGYWWFGNGLQDPVKGEIHLVVNDHGPIVPDQLESMLTTYRGGCTDESLPPPFPNTAKSNGIPGPNQCRLIQAVIFEQ